MEYIYAAMLLHKAGKDINEENIKAILQAAHVQVDDARVKALVAALEGVDIDKAIEKAAVATTAPATAPKAEAGEAKIEKKEEKKEEKQSEEQAAAGLGALFG